MTATQSIGVVAGIWRFPVKSMLGEQLEVAELTERGILGDRAHALIDVQTGKVASAKNVRMFPDLLACRASFVAEPQAERDLPAVLITLPNSRSVRSDAGDVDTVLSDYFRRKLSLAQIAPEDFTIDMYHPDLGEFSPRGRQDTVLEQKLGAAFFAQAGLPSPVSAGSFFDLFPLTILTTSTLRRLQEIRPESNFDHRRFRMNVIVESPEEGFIENGWINHELRVGEARLKVAVPDSRCVMTTLAQEDLPKDTEILKTLARHNRVQVADAGQYPCAGVYAVVQTPGLIRTNDPVVLG